MMQGNVAGGIVSAVAIRAGRIYQVRVAESGEGFGQYIQRDAGNADWLCLADFGKIFIAANHDGDLGKGGQVTVMDVARGGRRQACEHSGDFQIRRGLPRAVDRDLFDDRG